MPSLPPEYADLHRDTLAVRAAVERTAYGENSEALFLTSGYVQPSAEAAARRFAGEEDGFTYGRYGNPTVSSFELRLAALEGAEACISTASGMSAILMMCMGLLKAGDHVLCSRSMFGSTIKLIGSDLAKFGVESSFLPQADAAAWQAAIRPNTKLLFAETPRIRSPKCVTSAHWPIWRTTRVHCCAWTTALPRQRCSARWRWAPTS